MQIALKLSILIGSYRLYLKRIDQTIYLNNWL